MVAMSCRIELNAIKFMDLRLKFYMLGNFIYHAHTNSFLFVDLNFILFGHFSRVLCVPYDSASQAKTIRANIEAISNNIHNKCLIIPRI